MIALEVTDGVVDEAIRKKIDLLLTHHPPFFHPPSSITDSTQTGKQILVLARNQVAVYSAHTNLDATRQGVSVNLAGLLGLKNIRFLSPLEGKLSKLVVFVPQTHVDRIALEMANAGAGVIGDYEICSFRTEGTGTFKGSSTSNPYVGGKDSLERVHEVRLEMIMPAAKVAGIVRTLKRVHPYEEVAYEVYPTETPSANFGMGAVGELDRETTLQSFLQKCKQTLEARSIRYTGEARQKVGKVAVCGGSGSELLETAIREKADVFVTADVRYHTFQAAHDRIALVDAGHWETEHGILNSVRARLKAAAGRLNQKVSVIVSQTSTNPVRSI